MAIVRGEFGGSVMRGNIFVLVAVLRVWRILSCSILRDNWKVQVGGIRKNRGVVDDRMNAIGLMCFDGF